MSNAQLQHIITLSGLLSPSYTLKINIASDDVISLKASEYNLCIAKLVNDKYNVVWRGDMNFLDKNKFVFEDQFQVYGSKKFDEGALPEMVTDTVDIFQGQTVTLSSTGIWSQVVGTAQSGKPILLKNKYDTMSFGVDVLVGSTFGPIFSPIFVSPVPHVSGTIPFSPKRSFLVWFDRQLTTGTMFSDTKSNTVVVNFPKGSNEQTISYVTLPNEPANGIWVKDGSPVLGRTYIPKTNSFEIDSKFLPTVALIEKLNNFSKTENIEDDD